MACRSLCTRVSSLEIGSQFRQISAGLTSGSRSLALADLRSDRAVGHDRQCLLEPLEIIWADDYRGRLAVAGDDYAILLALNSIYEL